MSPLPFIERKNGIHDGSTTAVKGAIRGHRYQGELLGVVAQENGPEHEEYSYLTPHEDTNVIEASKEEEDEEEDTKFDVGLLSSTLSSSWTSTNGAAAVQVQEDHGPHTISRMLFTARASCNAGIVNCKSGFVQGQSSTSCKTACDGKCCVGPNACEYFTGKICKDTSTCVGDYACFGTVVPYVVGSCNGINTCINTGGSRSLPGKIGSIIGSCNGKSACAKAGLPNYHASIVGNITSSCNDEFACYKAGYDGGSVGDLVESCSGNKA